MKLSHVIPHIDDPSAGPSYSVPRLCQSLSAIGHEVELCCLAASAAVPGITVETRSQWPVLSRFAISPQAAMLLRRRASRQDVVHNHSLWSMINLAAGWVVPGQGARLVCSPRGTLSQWALSRNQRLKRWLWPLQRQTLLRSDLLHATSDAEYRDIRRAGLKAPVAVIPNGVDIPMVSAERSQRSQRTLLFLGRLHPTKAIEHLLSAWSNLQLRHMDWQLVIAGSGEPRYEAQLRQQADALGLRRVAFVGPVYGAEKGHRFACANLFVLPSHSENFAMAVAEALAHGVPAVVSKGAPWRGLESEACGWWVDPGVASLTTTLDEAMASSSQELAAMGLRGRNWMARDFGWAGVGERMDMAYRWLINGGECPPWIRKD